MLGHGALFIATFLLVVNIIDQVQSQCDGRGFTYYLNDHTLEIPSPGYDTGYMRNLSCNWLLTAAPNQSVLYMVKDIAVDCGDSISTYDGDNYNSPVMLDNICSQYGVYSEKPFSTEGSTMRLNFQTDSVSTARDQGFILQATSATDLSRCDVNNAVVSLTAESTMQVFTSPNFPLKYPKFFNCSWIIRARDPNGKVMVKFDFLDLERFQEQQTDPGSCIDNVVIYDGDTKVDELCGHPYFVTNKIYLSSGNNLTIVFGSDKYSEFRGFKASYFEPQHGGTTYSFHGENGGQGDGLLFHGMGSRSSGSFQTGTMNDGHNGGQHLQGMIQGSSGSFSNGQANGHFNQEMGPGNSDLVHLNAVHNTGHNSQSSTHTQNDSMTVTGMSSGYAGQIQVNVNGPLPSATTTASPDQSREAIDYLTTASTRTVDMPSYKPNTGTSNPAVAYNTTQENSNVLTRPNIDSNHNALQGQGFKQLDKTDMYQSQQKEAMLQIAGGQSGSDSQPGYINGQTGETSQAGYGQGQSAGHSQPGYTEGHMSGTSNPGYVESQTGLHTQPGYTEGHMSGTPQPGYVKGLTEGHSQPVYIEGQTGGSPDVGYVDSQPRGHNTQPGYTGGHTSNPAETGSNSQPGYTEGHTSGKTQTGHVEGQSGGHPQPGIIKGQTGGTSQTEYVEGQTRVHSQPGYTEHTSGLPQAGYVGDQNVIQYVNNEGIPQTGYIQGHTGGQSQPRDTELHTSGTHQPGYIDSQTGGHSQPGYTELHTSGTHQPGYIDGQTGGHSQPVYNDGQTTGIPNPGYFGETGGHSQKEILEGQTAGTPQIRYVEDQVGHNQPGTPDGHTSVTSETGYAGGQTGSNSQLVYSDGHAGEPSQSGYAEGQTEAHSQPGYTEGQTSGTPQLGYVDGQASSSSKPVFVDSQSGGTTDIKYVDGQAGGQFQPGLSEGQPVGSSQNGYVNGQTVINSQPGYTEGQTSGTPQLGYVDGQTSSNTQPVFVDSQSGGTTDIKYVDGQAGGQLQPGLSEGQPVGSSQNGYVDGQNVINSQPGYAEGQTATQQTGYVESQTGVNSQPGYPEGHTSNPLETGYVEGQVASTSQPVDGHTGETTQIRYVDGQQGYVDGPSEVYSQPGYTEGSTSITQQAGYVDGQTEINSQPGFAGGQTNGISQAGYVENQNGVNSQPRYTDGTTQIGYVEGNSGVNSQPGYIEGKTSGTSPSMDVKDQTGVHTRTVFTDGQSGGTTQTGTVEGQTGGHSQPGFIDGQISDTSQTGYIDVHAVVNSQPGFIAGQTDGTSQTGYFHSQTGGHSQPGYIEGETSRPSQTGYVDIQTGSHSQPGFIEGPTGDTSQTGYVDVQTGSHSQPGFIKGQTSDTSQTGYVDVQTGSHSQPGYIEGQTSKTPQSGYVDVQTGSHSQPGYIEGQTSDTSQTGYVHAQTGGHSQTGFIEGHTSDTSQTGYVDAQTGGHPQPGFIAGQTSDTSPTVYVDIQPGSHPQPGYIEGQTSDTSRTGYVDVQTGGHPQPGYNGGQTSDTLQSGYMDAQTGTHPQPGFIEGQTSDISQTGYVDIQTGGHSQPGYIEGQSGGNSQSGFTEGKSNGQTQTENIRDPTGGHYQHEHIDGQSRSNIYIGDSVGDPFLPTYDIGPQSNVQTSGIKFQEYSNANSLPPYDIGPSAAGTSAPTQSVSHTIIDLNQQGFPTFGEVSDPGTDVKRIPQEGGTGSGPADVWSDIDGQAGPIDAQILNLNPDIDQRQYIEGSTVDNGFDKQRNGDSTQGHNRVDGFRDISMNNDNGVNSNTFTNQQSENNADQTINNPGGSGFVNDMNALVLPRRVGSSEPSIDNTQSSPGTISLTVDHTPQEASGTVSDTSSILVTRENHADVGLILPDRNIKSDQSSNAMSDPYPPSNQASDPHLSQASDPQSSVSDSYPSTISDPPQRTLSDSYPTPVSDSNLNPVSGPNANPLSDSYPNPQSDSYPNPVSDPYPNPVSDPYPNSVTDSNPNTVSDSYPNPVSDPHLNPVLDPVSGPYPNQESANVIQTQSGTGTDNYIDNTLKGSSTSNANTEYSGDRNLMSDSVQDPNISDFITSGSGNQAVWSESGAGLGNVDHHLKHLSGRDATSHTSDGNTLMDVQTGGAQNQYIDGTDPGDLNIPHGINAQRGAFSGQGSWSGMLDLNAIGHSGSSHDINNLQFLETSDISNPASTVNGNNERGQTTGNTDVNYVAGDAAGKIEVNKQTGKNSDVNYVPDQAGSNAVNYVPGLTGHTEVNNVLHHTGGDSNVNYVPGQTGGNIEANYVPGQIGGNIDVNYVPGQTGENIDVNYVPGQTGENSNVKYAPGQAGGYSNVNYVPSQTGENIDVNYVPGETGRNSDVNYVPGQTGENIDVNYVPGQTGRSNDVNYVPGQTGENIDVNYVPGQTSENIDVNYVPGQTGGNTDVNYVPGQTGENIDVNYVPGQTDRNSDVNYVPGQTGGNSNVNYVPGQIGGNIDVNYIPGQTGENIDVNYVPGQTGGNSNVNYVPGQTGGNSDVNYVPGETTRNIDVDYVPNPVEGDIGVNNIPGKAHGTDINYVQGQTSNSDVNNVLGKSSSSRDLNYVPDQTDVTTDVNYIPGQTDGNSNINFLEEHTSGDTSVKFVTGETSRTNAVNYIGQTGSADVISGRANQAEIAGKGTGDRTDIMHQQGDKINVNYIEGQTIPNRNIDTSAQYPGNTDNQLYFGADTGNSVLSTDGGTFSNFLGDLRDTQFSGVAGVNTGGANTEMPTATTSQILVPTRDTNTDSGSSVNGNTDPFASFTLGHSSSSPGVTEPNGSGNAGITIPKYDAAMTADQSTIHRGSSSTGSIQDRYLPGESSGGFVFGRPPNVVADSSTGHASGFVGGVTFGDLHDLRNSAGQGQSDAGDFTSRQSARIQQNGRFENSINELYTNGVMSNMQGYTTKDGDSNQIVSNTGPCASQCVSGGDSCFVQHNCTHYKHCYSAVVDKCSCVIRRCPWGTLFSSEMGMCQAASNVNCEEDLCKKDLFLKTYSSGFNCKSYYVCSSGAIRRSLPMCCHNFHSFDEYEGRCVPNEKCGIFPCSRQFSTSYTTNVVTVDDSLEYPIDCPLKGEAGDPTLYNFKSFKLLEPMSCAPGTVFSEAQCTCIMSQTVVVTKHKPEGKVCAPSVYIDFSDAKIRNLISSVPVYSEGAHTVSSTNGASYGSFNGKSSFIHIPLFDGKSENKLAIRLRFYSNSNSGPNTQVLLADCHFTTMIGSGSHQYHQLAPSLAVLVNKKNKKLVVWASAADMSVQSVVMEVPIEMDTWNNAELVFDGRHIQLRVIDLSTRKEKSDVQPLKGLLGTFKQPLRIGGCGKYDGFHGFIDMVKIFECIPGRKGR